MVHTNGWQQSSQPSMKVSMAAMWSLMLVKVPRRVVWPVKIQKKIFTMFSHVCRANRTSSVDPFRAHRVAQPEDDREHDEAGTDRRPSQGLDGEREQPELHGLWTDVHQPEAQKSIGSERACARR